MINYGITLTFRLLHDRQGREVDQFDEESTRLGFRSVHHNSKLSVADPDPVPFDPWIRDPGWVKSQDPDHIS
jgi:hypothetical protein